MFFGYDMGVAPYLHYGIADTAGRIRHFTQVALPRGVMMHDFAITERYSIFLDLPVVFSSKGLQYQPELGARFGVIPRHGSEKDVRWFPVEPCWVYHVLNAWEAGDEIILAACRYPRFSFAGRNRATLHQWRLQLSSGRVVETPLDEVDSEFPRVRGTPDWALRALRLARTQRGWESSLEKYHLAAGGASRPSMAPDVFPMKRCSCRVQVGPRKMTAGACSSFTTRRRSGAKLGDPGGKRHRVRAGRAGAHPRPGALRLPRSVGRRDNRRMMRYLRATSGT